MPACLLGKRMARALATSAMWPMHLDFINYAARRLARV